jgi:hydrogenase-4 component F
MLLMLWFGVWPPEMLLQLLRDGAALLEVRP